LKKFLRNLFLFLCLVIFLSCRNPFSPPSKKGIYYLPSDSPEQVIENLRLAYNLRDIEAYKKCLHKDSFKFYFDYSDEEIGEILESRWGIDSMIWGWSEEVLSTEVLFSNVEWINLFLLKEYSFYVDSEHWVGIYWYDLDIEPSPVSGVVEGRARFTLKKENSNWFIIKWEDFVISGGY